MIMLFQYLVFSRTNQFLSPIQFSNMSLEIDQALTIALKNLISEITKNGELSKFSSSLQRRKQYDISEKEYIQNQRLRKQLGNEYESSDSEDEKENSYNKMPYFQLKRLMRKNLVDKKFDPQVLAPIKAPQSQHKGEQYDELTTVRLISDEPVSNMDIKTPTQLNIIQEAKEIVEQQQQKESTFALEFLIDQLEQIEKNTSNISLQY